MESAKNNKCRIYLTGWQQRMFTDFASKKILELFSIKRARWVEIKIGPIECLASYKLPPEGMRVDDWVLYLNDAQMTQVREELGVEAHVSEINVTMKEIEAGHIRFA